MEPKGFPLCCGAITTPPLCAYYSVLLGATAVVLHDCIKVQHGHHCSSGNHVKQILYLGVLVVIVDLMPADHKHVGVLGI